MEVLVGVLGKSSKGPHANVSVILFSGALRQLTVAGDLLSPLPDYLQHDPAVKSSTRRSRFKRYHTAVAQGHPEQKPFEAVCAPHSVRFGECWEGVPKTAVAERGDEA